MNILDLAICSKDSLEGYVKGLEAAMSICMREENPCNFNPACHKIDVAEIEHERNGSWEILERRFK